MDADHHANIKLGILKDVVVGGKVAAEVSSRRCPREYQRSGVGIVDQK